MTRLRATLVVALLGLAAACGIQADDGPRAITQDQRPDDLERDAAPTDGPTLRAEVYFTRYDGDRYNLVAVETAVQPGSSSSRPTPATVLEALLDGVDDADEDAPNIVTKIPPDTELAGPPVLDDAGVLTVHLTTGISGVWSDGARLAYGQLVCTAAALDEVESVRFIVGDQPIQAPTGEGETSTGPLTCDSYANVLEAASD